MFHRRVGRYVLARLDPSLSAGDHFPLGYFLFPPFSSFPLHEVSASRGPAFVSPH